MLNGKNIVVLDCETARSADDCRHCGRAFEDCHTGNYSRDFSAATLLGHSFEKIGWDNKIALGLSIACLYRYDKDTYQFIDPHNLEEAMQWLVATQPLIVSFNGLTFDGPLLRAILRNRPVPLHIMCDQFKDLMARGYDLLQEIWKLDSTRRFQRGLNSLVALSLANGFGTKELNGAAAPRLWAQGRYAEVMSYCLSDVWKTRQLFDLVCTGTPLIRGNGSALTLPLPQLSLTATVASREGDF